MSGKFRRRRLFFALWPSRRVRAEIADRRAEIRDCSGRPVPDHNLHLTLLFLGNQPDDRLDEIIQAADEIRSNCFHLALDRFGWFAEARVAWLGGSATDAAQGLVSQLSERMRGLGLTFAERPWVPHVTLFRRVSEAPDFPEIKPVEWVANGFSLIESIPGKPYVPLVTAKLA